VAQKELEKLLNNFLDINLRVSVDNTKMDIKGSGFVFRLNSSLQHGRAGFLEK